MNERSFVTRKELKIIMEKDAENHRMGKNSFRDFALLLHETLQERIEEEITFPILSTLGDEPPEEELNFPFPENLLDNISADLAFLSAISISRKPNLETLLHQDYIYLLLKSTILEALEDEKNLLLEKNLLTLNFANLYYNRMKILFKEDDYILAPSEQNFGKKALENLNLIENLSGKGLDKNGKRFKETFSSLRKEIKEFLSLSKKSIISLCRFLEKMVNWLRVISNEFNIECNKYTHQS